MTPAGGQEGSPGAPDGLGGYGSKELEIAAGQSVVSLTFVRPEALRLGRGQGGRLVSHPLPDRHHDVFVRSPREHDVGFVRRFGRLW